MYQQNLSALVSGLLGLIVFAYAAEFALSFTDDAREPKRVRARIPLIGHILGLIRHGPAYYNLTSLGTDLGLYTVDALGIKMYVSNDRRLAPLVMKAHKVITFRPFVKVAAEKLAGNSKAGCNLFDGPLLDDYSQAIKMTLSPGEALDEMNVRMGRESVIQLESLVNSCGGPHGKTVKLLEWVRHAVVQATSCSMFGVKHPFRDAAVENAFWKWQVYLPTHMAGLDIFGQADRARCVVHKSMLDYCAAVPDDASLVVREQQRVLRDSGMTFEDAAGQECSFCVAMFGNTAPTLYWSIYEIFSRPQLLDEIREELLYSHTVARSMSGGDGNEQAPFFTLDVASLKTKCPILLSSYQEVQRFHDVHANIRKVTADTFLDDGRYLLRKGNYCLIPTSTVHGNRTIWGEDAALYDPYRFMSRYQKKSGDSLPSSASVPAPSDFLAWGTPPHLCPARQFASTEVLILLALLAMQVDLVPRENNGRWVENPAIGPGELSAVPNPKTDVEVEVRPRRGWGGDGDGDVGVGKTTSSTWSLKMGESRTRVALASG